MPPIGWFGGHIPPPEALLLAGLPLLAAPPMPELLAGLPVLLLVEPAIAPPMPVDDEPPAPELLLPVSEPPQPENARSPRGPSVSPTRSIVVLSMIPPR